MTECTHLCLCLCQFYLTAHKHSHHCCGWLGLLTARNKDIWSWKTCVFESLLSPRLLINKWLKKFSFRLLYICCQQILPVQVFNHSSQGPLPCPRLYQQPIPVLAFRRAFQKHDLKRSWIIHDEDKIVWIYGIYTICVQYINCMNMLYILVAWSCARNWGIDWCWRLHQCFIDLTC